MKTKILTPLILLSFLSYGNAYQNEQSQTNNVSEKEKREKIQERPGSSDTLALTKTSEMLEEERYWTIAERSLKNSANQEEQEQMLVREIGGLTPKEMIGFRLRTDKLLYDTYTSEIWCAGYIMNTGCSDDGFEYFRNWVISRGKETYYKAKQNPDNLIAEVKEGKELYEFESFWYVAQKAFTQKTGKELYDYIDIDNFKTREGNYPQFEFNWEESNPESIRKICPNLFGKLWKR
jgi:hypothetical protein